jgi:hypothetical protein
MKKRSPLAVFLLAFLTIGIYSWYWAVKTKGELNQRGGSVPTAWMWLVPVIGPLLWWLKYSAAVEIVTNGGTSSALSFVLLFFTGPIGQAVLQGKFNRVGTPATAGAAVSPPPVPAAVS